MIEEHPYDALPSRWQLGSYEIQRVLGRGAFGITYAARKDRTEELFAIKELCPQGYCERKPGGRLVARHESARQDLDKMISMFLQEAELVCSLRHPNLVQGVEAFEANSTGYLVMRYVSGKSLFDHLRTKSVRFPMTPGAIAALLKPLAAALSALHDRGAIHCDIKPDNIIFGIGFQPILIDLGAARLGDPAQGWERPATYFPHFAAIEQHSAEAGLPGPWTDIYQLAAVIYRCITGAKPPDCRIRARSKYDPYLPLLEIPEMVSCYPRVLLETIDYGLGLSPSQRPSSVNEWLVPAAHEIDRLLDTGSFSVASSPGSGSHPVRHCTLNYRTPFLAFWNCLCKRLTDSLSFIGFGLVLGIVIAALVIVSQCSG